MPTDPEVKEPSQQPCNSCGHATPHKRLGPIKDLNGFQHNDECEECDCINFPTYVPPEPTPEAIALAKRVAKMIAEGAAVVVGAPAHHYLHDNQPPSVRDRMQQYADESTQLAMLLGRIRRALGITVDPLKKYTLEQVEEEIMSKIGEMTTGGQTVETPRCWKSHDWKSDAAGVFRCTRCGVLVSACQPAVETSWNVHSKCRC